MWSPVCIGVFIIGSIPLGVFGLYPVVVLSGLGGNQLVANIQKKESVVNKFCVNQASTYTIWLDFPTTFSLVSVFTNTFGKCWSANFKLRYDKKTRRTSDAPGVTIQTAEFGKCYGLEWLHSPTKLFKFLNHFPLSLILDNYQLFNHMFDVLEKKGLKRDVSIKAALYDFRKGPHESQGFYSKLKTLIEETYEANGQKPCVIIGYSMGAPFALQFFHQQPQAWKDKYIKVFVPLGGNFGGCLSPITMYCEGSDLGIKIMAKERLREVLLTTTSMPFQAPTEKYWGNTPLVTTAKKNYTVGNMKELFQDLPDVEDWESLWMMYQDTEPARTNLDPPNVPVCCICSNGIDTPERLVYSGNGIRQGKRVFVNGPGDGTVPIRCCSMCKEWAGKQKQKVEYKENWKIGHLPMIKNDVVIKQICDIVLGP